MSEHCYDCHRRIAGRQVYRREVVVSQASHRGAVYGGDTRGVFLGTTDYTVMVSLCRDCDREREAESTTRERWQLIQAFVIFAFILAIPVGIVVLVFLSRVF